MRHPLCYRAPMSDRILVTGATGHIGTALLPRLLDDPDAVVLALVRAKDADHLEVRRKALVSSLPGEVDGSRVIAIAGDVSAKRLGLSDADHARVLGEVTSIIHSAASVRFDMPEDKASEENIGSVEEILSLARSLAERGSLSRLDHVSTAYVAGDRVGRVLETECDVGQGFRNSYEWSKCKAEMNVRAAIDAGLPAAIHRPSIVVGDSHTGETKAFNVLYWPLKLYARGWWRLFPGSPDTLVDIVPVDFVAEAIATLRRDSATIGECFNLAAGDDAERVDVLAERFATELGRPPIRYVEPGMYVKWMRPVLAAPISLTKRGRTILRGGKAYLPYFRSNPLFDTTNLKKRLGRGAPPVLAYVDQILRFAKEQDFGGR